MLPGFRPIVLRDRDPLSVGKTGERRAEGKRVRGGEERRVFDAREDVEVCEGREDEDRDNGLDGGEDCVRGQRAQNRTHFGGGVGERVHAKSS